MKHSNLIHSILSFALVLALVLSLSACGKTGETPATETKAATAAPAQSDTQPAAQPETQPETQPVTTASNTDPVLMGIYESLIKEDSPYAEIKGYYDFMPEVQFTETVEGDRLTVSASGSEYIEGSWEYVSDGEYLSTTVKTDDMMGVLLVSAMAGVVADYLGMDPDLTQGYLRGVNVLGIENDDLIIETDEAAGTCSFRFRITGPYAMKELDQMVVDDRLLNDFEPLNGENSDFTSFSIGKLMIICSGTADDFSIFLSEYGESDAVALTSLQNIAAHFQPAGFQSFVESYASLEEVQTDEYSVWLDADEEALSEWGLEKNEQYSYMTVHFGTGGEEPEE